MIENENELPDILENLCFVSISAQSVGKSKASDVIKLLNHIAYMYELDLRKPIHNVIAQRILINSVINN